MRRLAVFLVLVLGLLGVAPDVGSAGPPAPSATTTFVWQTDCGILIIITWQDFRANSGYFAVKNTTNTATIYDTTMDQGGLIDFGRAKRSSTQAYALYNGAYGVGFTGDVRPFAAVFSPKGTVSINDLGDVTSCPYATT